MTPPLPIDRMLPDVVSALGRTNRVVLRAEPGAGKTTRVPAALLDAGLSGNRHVVVIEPRRIAARAAAEFVARERGGPVGGEVGYRVRFARKGGVATRLWFLTEGVFGRDLARDPFLEDVGVVVLDEFHERHLQSDVALAIVRELQDTVRPDLRLVVMSATLDTTVLAAFLDGAEVLTSEGRAYPVAVEYDTADHGRRLEDRVAAVVGRMRDEPGDVLVFLPGAGEIRRVASALAPIVTRRGIDVVSLHGDQPLDEQARALRAGPRPRIVLATNVAETALTVEGITTVIDGGLARVARFDARTGLDRLRLSAISRSSATQRAGRAGRLGPGRCIRLWSRDEEQGRREHEVPEILRVDLARTLLELAAWGLRDATTLPWLDPPPRVALARAHQLLVRLGAFESDGDRVSALGRRMLAMPVSPRLARMLCAAEDEGVAADGALLVALASERDVLRAARAFGSGTIEYPPGASDLLLRAELVEEALRAGGSPAVCERLGLDPRAVRAVEHTRRQLVRRAVSSHSADPAALLRTVLAGFPDRLCRRREPGSSRAVMTGGTGVTLTRESVVRETELFVAVDVDGGERGTEARVRLASAVDRAWLEHTFPGSVAVVREAVFDASRERVVARTQTRYHDLVLEESVRTDVDPVEAGALLAAHVASDPIGVLGAEHPVGPLVLRLAFLGREMPELGLPSPSDVVRDAVTALAGTVRSLTELRRTDVVSVVHGLLSHAQRVALERDAPTHWTLPSGRRVPITYDRDRPPVLAARIQEVFGLASTPRLAGGRVPIVFELLAPSHRPMQTTSDLASFWRTTYAQVRAELRGRYPRHPWPEDPTTARPTARAKPRSR